MTTAKWHFDLNPNLSKVERLSRYLLGGALIGVILLAAPTPVGWVALLPLIAIPVVISAIIRWDPLYALFQKLPLPRKLSVKAAPGVAAAAA